MMNYLGFYLYVTSIEARKSNGFFIQAFCLIACGLCLGAATTFRGNGLLSGLVLAVEALELAYGIVMTRSLGWRIIRLSMVILGGTTMALAAVVPQYRAYLDYCLPTKQRPWCSQWAPSIYAWVQSEYWCDMFTYSPFVSPFTDRCRNVGLFHYWTWSNLPLFLLAFPMLLILFTSSIWSWQIKADQPQERSSKATNTERGSRPRSWLETSMAFPPHQANVLVRRLSIPQITLAALAFTTYHVQIITRLSSGYPVWYWWLAWCIYEDQGVSLAGLKVKPAPWIIRWMVLYAMIQGGLFASFLPPA